jgi:hypothetical protein
LEKHVKHILIGTMLLLSAAPALAQPNRLATVQRVRADYPTPMSPAQQAELLNRVAWEHRAEGWGLLIKTGGNRCPAPQGVDVACDILVHAPTQWHYDVLVDAGAAAGPAWGDAGPCDPNISGCSMDRFLAPIAPAGMPSVVAGAFARAIGGDIDADGRGDLLVQDSSGGVTAALTRGSAFQIQPVHASTTDWLVVGFGNFDSLGYPDVVWQHPSGTVVVWTFNMSATHQVLVPFAGTSSWRVAAVADIDRDTNADLLWQGPAGEVVVWFMQGQSVRSTQLLWGYPTQYRLAAVGDFNGDGSADIVWQHPTGSVVLWFMQGASLVSGASAFSGASSWQIAAAADLDGNGISDLVWRSPTNQFVVWSMNGGQTLGTLYMTLGPQWQLYPQ